MNDEQIKAISEAYDLAFRSFDPTTSESREAKALFWKLFEDSYVADCPENEIPRHEYKRKVVSKCLEWLKKNS